MKIERKHAAACGVSMLLACACVVTVMAAVAAFARKGPFAALNQKPTSSNFQYNLDCDLSSVNEASLHIQKLYPDSFFTKYKFQLLEVEPYWDYDCIGHMYIFNICKMTYSFPQTNMILFGIGGAVAGLSTMGLVKTLK